MYTGEINQWQRRKAGTEILIWRSEQTLELKNVFKETSRKLVLFHKTAENIKTICACTIVHKLMILFNRPSKKYCIHLVTQSFKGTTTWKDSKKKEIRKDKKRRNRNPEVGSGGWNQGFKYSRRGKRRYHTWIMKSRQILEFFEISLQGFGIIS